VNRVPYTIHVSAQTAGRWLGITTARETLLHRAGWREFDDIVNHQRMRLDDVSPGTWELAVELRALPHSGCHHATVTLPPSGRATRHRVSRSFDEDDPDPRTWITQSDAVLDANASSRLRELLESATVTPLDPTHTPVIDGAPFRLVAATRKALDAYDLGGNAAGQYEDPRVVELVGLVLGDLRDA